MRPNSILPEFQELHAVYARVTEVRDRLLHEAPAQFSNQLFAELLGRYAALGSQAAELLIFLRSRVKDFDGPLYQLWLDASRVLSVEACGPVISSGSSPDSARR